MVGAVLLLPIVACTAPSASEPGASVVAPEHEAPMDRDGDGIPDELDACPDEPEDIDHFEDEDGCVDRDNDQDGIPDAQDFIDGRWTNCDFALAADGAYLDCRNQPEDHDGAHDLDGCPDTMTCDGPPLIAEVSYDARGQLGPSVAEELSLAINHIEDEPRTQFWLVPPPEESASGGDDPACTAMERLAEALVAQGASRENIVIASERLAALFRRRAEDRLEIDVYVDPQCPCRMECRREVTCR